MGFFTILKTVVIISDQKLAEETGKAFKKDKKLLKGEHVTTAARR
jgi:hypothetical protein